MLPYGVFGDLKMKFLHAVIETFSVFLRDGYYPGSTFRNIYT